MGMEWMDERAWVLFSKVSTGITPSRGAWTPVRVALPYLPLARSSVLENQWAWIKPYYLQEVFPDHL